VIVLVADVDVDARRLAAARRLVAALAAAAGRRGRRAGRHGEVVHRLEFAVPRWRSPEWRSCPGMAFSMVAVSSRGGVLRHYGLVPG